MSPAETDTGVSGALTDGSGIGRFTGSKILKDLVLDALLSVPVSLAAIGITGLPGAYAAPLAVSMAIGEALIKVAYRALLKWSQTP